MAAVTQVRILVSAVLSFVVFNFNFIFHLLNFFKERFKVNVMFVLRDQMNENISSIIFSAILTKNF